MEFSEEIQVATVTRALFTSGEYIFSWSRFERLITDKIHNIEMWQSTGLLKRKEGEHRHSAWPPEHARFDYRLSMRLKTWKQLVAINTDENVHEQLDWIVDQAKRLCEIRDDLVHNIEDILCEPDGDQTRFRFEAVKHPDPRLLSEVKHNRREMTTDVIMPYHRSYTEADLIAARKDLADLYALVWRSGMPHHAAADET
jgi:hypothetical protein